MRGQTTGVPAWQELMGDADNLERPLPLRNLSVPEQIEVKNGWLLYSVLSRKPADRLPSLTEFLKLSDASEEAILVQRGQHFGS